MITSTSNQQMKNLTLLMKKAKARNEQGVFVAEGRKMFLEAPVEWVKQVYVSESFYGTCTQGNMQDCMESCTPKHGEEKLNRKVLERLNETGYEIAVSYTHLDVYKRQLQTTRGYGSLRDVS